MVGRQAVAVAVAGVALAGLTALPADASGKTVDVYNAGFVAQGVSILVGETVTFVDKTGVYHEVAANDGTWTRKLPAGGTVTVRFTTPGTVGYHDAIYPYRTGVVNVA